MKPLPCLVVEAVVETCLIAFAFSVSGWSTTLIWRTLFAETTDHIGTIVAALVAFIAGGGLWKLWDAIAARKDQQRKDKLEDEKRVTDYQQELIGRYEKERVDLKKEAVDRETEVRKLHQRCEEEKRELEDELREEKLKSGRMELYAESLEERLEAKAIPFRKWRPDGFTPPPRPRGDSSTKLPTHHGPVPPVQDDSGPETQIEPPA